MPASQFGGSANRVRRQVTGTMSTGPIPTFSMALIIQRLRRAAESRKLSCILPRHGGICTIPRYWCLTLR